MRPVRAGKHQGGLIMASSSVAAQRDPSSRRSPPSSNAPAGGQAQQLKWIPIALGAAAVAVGLAGRRKGAAALALSAFAGAAAVGAVPGVRPVLGKASGKRHCGAPEVERSIEIGKSEDELRGVWLDARTLPQVMAGFATVRPNGNGRMHWKVEGPLGSAHEWDTETLDRPGADLGWRSLSDSAVRNEGSLRFHPAPAGRGTVVTLRVRLHPPGGALGGRIVESLGTTPLELVAEGALRRFKNLVETGEIPTTARQPAARADGD
jgi:uncharacterized membrane protein